MRYLPRMLGDPVRVVRMEAAGALAGEGEAALSGGQRAAFAKALDEHIAALRYNADRPEGRMSLGNLHARRGDAAAAIAQFRAAMVLDPTFVASYVNLADLLRSGGAEGEAEKVLREGLVRNPQAADLHHALGLSLVRQRRAADGQASFATAVRLAPGNARYAYVLAVSVADGGQTVRARQLLDAARAKHPYDRDILEAVVSYAMRDGDAQAARAAATSLAEIDPDNAQHAATLRQLGAASPRR